MNTSGRTFTYTAYRAAYISTIIALLFIMLAEGSLITFVITLFIHNGWLKLLPAGMLGGLLLYIVCGMLAPFYTKHELTESHLLLCYGFALNIRIPRSEIAAAQAVREQLTMLQSFKAAYNSKLQRIVAAFSDQGQVLLHLDRPRVYKVGRAGVLVQTLLFNVDRRDEFLGMLGVPETDVERAKREERRDPIYRVPREQRGNVTTQPHPVGRDKSGPYGGEAQPRCAIRTENLTRSFHTIKAVDNLNLSIAQCEIYGFLGSNGAGKTTAMKMLVGLLEPSAGQAWVAGYNVWGEPLPAKIALGYVADRAVLYERLTGREFLSFLGQMRGIPLVEAGERIKRLLDVLELTEHADRLCGAYSFGMKRKLALAGALLHSPRILILDEPLNGLDPRSARRLKDLFIELAAAGTTILLSTHDLATAGTVCHRIGILHRGRLLAEGSVSELEQMAAAADLEAVFLSLTAEKQEEIAI